jgi:hypothetical protein
VSVERRSILAWRTLSAQMQTETGSPEPRCQEGSLMTHEYDDPVTQARLDLAANRALVLLDTVKTQTGPFSPLHSLAARAVEETFCVCVTNAEDAVEGKLSRIHAVLIEEVVKRVQAGIAARPPTVGPPDTVDGRPTQSLPAGTPPG